MCPTPTRKVQSFPSRYREIILPGFEGVKHPKVRIFFAALYSQVERGSAGFLITREKLSCWFSKRSTRGIHATFAFDARFCGERIRMVTNTAGAK